MFGDLEWVPIHYINRATTRQRLISVYRNSAVGLVTPLRDGMNLVAKEYVAAQSPDNPGVLILSQFAGASEQMVGALIVNPYNVDEIAEAIRTAVEMPLAERKRRYIELMLTIEEHSAAEWADAFLETLADPTPRVDGPTATDSRFSSALRSLTKSGPLIDSLLGRPDAQAGAFAPSVRSIRI